MLGVLKISRLIVNNNLGTIEDFEPDVHIDISQDYPIRWEAYQYKPTGKRKPIILTKIYLASGDTLKTRMTIDEFEDYYSKFCEIYDAELMRIEKELTPN